MVLELPLPRTAFARYTPGDAVQARPDLRADLFQMLRDTRPRTRTELSAMMGLARSTVALRIDALVRLGLVCPAGEAKSTGGRPSSRFTIASSARAVLAVDVGPSQVRIAVSDLAGRIQAETRAGIAVAEGPATVFGWVEVASRDLLGRLGRGRADLMAIGIALPGPVEHSTGRPTNPAIMPGWDRFDVVGWFRDRFDVPALVDNNLNLMALAERELSWPYSEPLLFVNVGANIGSAVISGGFVQRGADGMAGDIGHVYVARGAAVACRCGNHGCLEALASGPAIGRALKDVELRAETTQDVVEIVKRGNIDAIQAVRQAGRDIGEVLTTCVSLINPSVIVIGGSLAQAGEHLIAGVRELVYTRSMPLAAEHLQITKSKAGPDATVLGASMLAIHHALSPENIQSLMAG